jgi:UDP-N-acetylenolpyruvoylglucosamine reductase
VGDAAHTGQESMLGWYSLAQLGGEIGDIPINEIGAMHMPLQEVFKEVSLTDGSGTVPIQLMWSNADGGPSDGSPTPMQST